MHLLYNDCYQISFYPVITCPWIDVMLYNLFIFIWYLNPGKTDIFLESSWKNHGIRFRNSAGNPEKGKKEKVEHQYRDGTARYTENWRTIKEGEKHTKKERKKRLNTNTGMARPVTRKIGGPKKGEKNIKISCD